MIRLCCISQWIDDNHITPADATLLANNRKWVTDLLNDCRNVIPTDWRNVIHAQKLAGIPNREIQRRYNYTFNSAFFSRVSKSDLSMDTTWLNWDKANNFITEWYIGAAAKFWVEVLEPLQFKDYVEDFDTSLHFKAWMVIKFRDILRYLPTETSTKLNNILSLGISQQTVLYDIPELDRRISMMAFGYNTTNKPNAATQWEYECNVLRYYAREIDVAYTLLCKCQCQGIMNRELMFNVQNLFWEHLNMNESEDVNEYIKLVR